MFEHFRTARVWVNNNRYLYSWEWNNDILKRYILSPIALSNINLFNYYLLLLLNIMIIIKNNKIFIAIETFVLLLAFIL